MTSHDQHASATATPRAQDPVHGMAVLCAGRGENRMPATAIWHIAVSGAFTGAWIMPRPDLSEPYMARRALTLLERRPLLVWNREQPRSTLTELITTAQLTPESVQPWRDHSCHIPEAVTHLRAARAAHAAAMEEKPGAAPLRWKLDLPPATPTDLVGFLLAVRRATPHTASPVAAEALALATAARWCLQAWQDTEAVRLRRPLLRQRFGPEQPVPPSWIAALQAQYPSCVRHDGNRLAPAYD